jgi:ATP-dependent Clp protease ATP-binding subunit ClpC
LVNQGYQPEMGARPIRRTVEQYLEDPLAEKLLLEPDKPKNFLISEEGGKLKFTEQPIPEEFAKKEEADEEKDPKKRSRKKKMATANSGNPSQEKEDVE